MNAEVTITADPRNRSTFAVVEQLALRVDGIMRWFPWFVATLAMDNIIARAPDDVDGYPDSLELRRYAIKPWDSAIGIVVPATMRYQKLRTVDARRTVMYIHPKLVRGQADPAAVVLWRSNPWTMETLPYEPAPREARIIVRRVTEREATEIARLRRTDAPRIAMELAATGRAIGRAHPTLLKRKVERDLAFEILRREYGVGDAPHVPHWRPAIRLARGVLTDRVMRQMLRWLTGPSEKKWNRRLRVSRGKPSDVTAIQHFQGRVASAGQ